MNKKIKIATLVLTFSLVGATPAYAALTDTTNLTQQINPGVLSTFIGDTTGTEVPSPNVTFPSTSVSVTTQTSVGSYGTDTQRIYIDNAAGADNGWTLAFAATGGSGATWTSGGNTYPFNAATSTLGQLTINPAVGTLVADVGTTTGITMGSTGTFSGGANSPIGILSASSSSSHIGRVHLTGVTASQTIPAAQPAGTYVIDFTQTAAAV